MGGDLQRPDRQAGARRGLGQRQVLEFREAQRDALAFGQFRDGLAQLLSGLALLVSVDPDAGVTLTDADSVPPPTAFTARNLML